MAENFKGLFLFRRLFDGRYEVFDKNNVGWMMRGHEFVNYCADAENKRDEG